MKDRLKAEFGLAGMLGKLFVLLVLPAAAWAQVPVDENGDLIGGAEPKTYSTTTGNEDIPLMSAVDLEELVGPIALYPDDLLAIVLPASAYPLQIVDAARFLEELENDPTLKPDPEWDDSVVALTNYPEVVELMNDDIDWTWRLGEAVVSQQADVVAAIETFRDRAYAAGNLKSDAYQKVTHDEGVIEITPIAEDVIYVPYYEPERVVVYQPRPVYYYYPRPYPVYYYPYPSWYAFDRGYFWGVTTAFTIGWYSDSLNVFHHSYYGHPYYGRSYRDRWWYRRPTINIYSNHYVGGNTSVTVNHYDRGDRWRPRANRRDYVPDRRITRNRYNPSRHRADSAGRVSSVPDRQRTATLGSPVRRQLQTREPIAFRERPGTRPAAARDQRSDTRSERPGKRSESRSENGARRRQEAARVAPRSTAPEDAGPSRTGSMTTRTQLPRQREEQPRVPRTGPGGSGSETASAPRRRDTAAALRRSEAVRRVPRAESMAQLRHAEASTARENGRAQPAPHTSRSSAPVRDKRLAQPAPEIRRSAPSREAATAAAPRSEKAEGKRSGASDRRERPDRSSRRQR